MDNKIDAQDKDIDAVDENIVNIIDAEDEKIDAEEDENQHKWEHWPSPASWAQEMGLQCTKKDWPFSWEGEQNLSASQTVKVGDTDWIEMSEQ